MSLNRRKLIDRSFSGLGVFSIVLMAAALLVILAPIFVRGFGAFVFRGTVEWRKMMMDFTGRGDAEEIEAEIAQARKARQPVYDMLAAFEKDLAAMDVVRRPQYTAPLEELKDALHDLLGPRLDSEGRKHPMPHERYGQTRWDRAQVKIHHVLFVETYDYSDPTKLAKLKLVPRVNAFKGTALEPLFGYLEKNVENIFQPRWTLYVRFLTDPNFDTEHFFGGIWAEMLGTIYLAVGTMIFAVPMGVIAAIYLVEYAGQTRFISLLRSCISTLAGVPSIVFGLFGLAFFINGGVHVSRGKSVLAGSLTLAILVLPTIIRASEEAIRAVPHTYKEGALSLGAGKWRTVLTVILPAALPGILTGIVISMGRAAGETAPIMFTAAFSVGKPLQLLQTLSRGTPALPWNIYNLATEHQAIDEIRHVQYGMVMVLVLVVLILSLSAILLRARISRKLRGG